MMPIEMSCIIAVCALLVGGGPRECAKPTTPVNQERRCISLAKLDPDAPISGSMICFEVEEARSREECLYVFRGLAGLPLLYHRAVRFEWAPRPKSVNAILGEK